LFVEQMTHSTMTPQEIEDKALEDNKLRLTETDVVNFWNYLINEIKEQGFDSMTEAAQKQSPEADLAKEVLKPRVMRNKKHYRYNVSDIMVAELEDL